MKDKKSDFVSGLILIVSIIIALSAMMYVAWLMGSSTGVVEVTNFIGGIILRFVAVCIVGFIVLDLVFVLFMFARDIITSHMIKKKNKTVTEEEYWDE